MTSDKVCCHCGTQKKLEEFSWLNRAKNRRNSRCKICRREYDREYYRSHERVRKAMRERYRKRQQKIRDFVIEAKSVPCSDCGGIYPYYVMDFDHVRGKKKFSIGEVLSLGVSLEKVEKEVAKCDVVCANHHRIRTFKRRQRNKVKLSLVK